MATLRGHAVSGAAPGLGPAYEHTYVTSDDGYVWHCLGQSIAGRVLRSGSGNSAVADCVSHPEGSRRVALHHAGLRRPSLWARRGLSPDGEPDPQERQYRRIRRTPVPGRV